MNRSTSTSRKKKKKKPPHHDDQNFINTIFTWSLQGIFNKDLYNNKVDYIDLSFTSAEQYFQSFVYPLLEETRAQLCSCMEILSSSPYAEVISLERSQSHSYGRNHYVVKIDTWKNRSSGHGKELYKKSSGDVFILADFKPETINDLQMSGRTWSFVLSAGLLDEGIERDDDENKLTSTFKVTASKDIDIDQMGQNSLFIIFLTNITPNRRIWNALHMDGESRLIEKILCASDVVEESCDHCSPKTDALRDDVTYQRLSSELNESQNKAICACLSSFHCNHKSTVDLIWGPPGTGKTKTLGTLLFALFKMNCRTLVCAPTNVAIKEVASRVLSMVRDSFDRNFDALFCNLGDMLLFDNHERLKVGAEIEEIYLDYRVKQLILCFTPPNGWKYCFASMIDLLENCVSHYQIFIENEMRKEQDQTDDNNFNRQKDDSPSDSGVGIHKSFVEFVRERFLAIVLPLRDCISILCTHIARRCIMEHNLKDLARLIYSLGSFQALLFGNNIVCEKLEELFSPPESQHSSFESVVVSAAEHSLHQSRSECLSLLRTLNVSLDDLNLPDVVTEESIREFCLQSSLLIFSTASSSFKLHSVDMEPLDVLVIDEAAQLKECESIIPLLLSDINHAILVGDECQLSAMIESSVSFEVGFGRSLFARLSTLGHPNHFLNIQYRMHPAISSFPNSCFYLNQILDASNVTGKNYRKQYLPGQMFGPYSFINIIGGTEEFDDAGQSRKNMVEVAVVMKIIRNCFRAWLESNENLSIGVVSPYAAQVVSLQDMLGQKYDKHKGFDVKVKTIDGFQGGEQDIIILSTVRTDCSTSLGFISNNQRTNVALTRARHCLWILGNERTLVSQENLWKDLVLDAKKRKCFFNADEDKDLAKGIWDAKKELDQLDGLFNADSLIFRNSRWKVFFSDNFLKSFKNLPSKRTKMSVLNLLLKLSSGWRPKRIKVDLLCGNSSQMLKQYKVEGLFIVCSKDIVKELNFTQVLRIWDILPPEDIPKVVKHLDSIFGSYTDDFIRRCSEQCFEGKMEVPMNWEKSTEIIKIKNLDSNGNEAELSCCVQRIYVENSKVKMIRRRETLNRARLPQKEQRKALVCDVFRSEIETAVDNAFKTQTEIEKVNEEKRVSKLRLMIDKMAMKTICDKRNALIRKIPQFWKNVFLNHPLLKKLINDVDKKILDSLLSVEVGENKMGKPGYTISFEFDKNDYIKYDKKVEKHYHELKRKTIIEVSGLEWTGLLDRKARKKCFFFWLEDKDVLYTGKTVDERANIIVQLWPNPWHYYDNKMEQRGSDSSSSFKEQVSENDKKIEEEIRQIQLESEKIDGDESRKDKEIDQKCINDLKVLFDKRQEQVRCLPRFWCKAFMAHQNLFDKLNSIDKIIFESLTSIEVKQQTLSGHSIAFNFSENGYFSNQCIEKQLTFDKGELTSTTATAMEWKRDVPDIVEKSDKDKKLAFSHPKLKKSFFHWFRTSNDVEALNEHGDWIGEHIMEVWNDPFKCLHNDSKDTEDEAEEKEIQDEVKRRRKGKENQSEVKRSQSEGEKEGKPKIKVKRKNRRNR